MGCNNPTPSQKDNNKEDSTLRIKQNSKEVEKEKKIL